MTRWQQRTCSNKSQLANSLMNYFKIILLFFGIFFFLFCFFSSWFRTNSKSKIFSRTFLGTGIGTGTGTGTLPDGQVYLLVGSDGTGPDP